MGPCIIGKLARPSTAHAMTRIPEMNSTGTKSFLVITRSFSADDRRRGKNLIVPWIVNENYQASIYQI